MHAVERCVGGEVRGRAVGLGEENETGVFHAVRLGQHDRPEDPLRDVDVLVEVHAVTARRDRSVLTGNGVRVLARVELRDQNLQARFELLDGEHDGQLVEDVGGALTVLAHRLQSRVKDVAVKQAVTRRAVSDYRLARVEGDLPVGADETGAKTDARTMSLTDAAITHHESHGAFGYVRLIRVHDDAGVAYRGGFERILVREGGTEEEPALFTEVLFRVETVTHALGVL